METRCFCPNENMQTRLLGRDISCVAACRAGSMMLWLCLRHNIPPQSTLEYPEGLYLTHLHHCGPHPSRNSRGFGFNDLSETRENEHDSMSKRIEPITFATDLFDIVAQMKPSREYDCQMRISRWMPFRPLRRRGCEYSSCLLARSEDRDFTPSSPTWHRSLR